MSVNDGLARPWAASVFARASETNRIEAWANMLLVLEQAVASPAWSHIINDGRVSSERKIEILTKVCGDFIDAEGKNLIRLLANYHRLGILKELRQQFAILKDRAEGVVEVEITTAFTQPEADEATLLANLKKRFGPKIRLVRREDKKLIGGIIIRQGDRVLDASIQGSLERASRYLRV